VRELALAMADPRGKVIEMIEIDRPRSGVRRARTRRSAAIHARAGAGLNSPTVGALVAGTPEHVGCVPCPSAVRLPAPRLERRAVAAA